MSYPAGSPSRERRKASRITRFARFRATAFADNRPVRALLDRFDAEWEREEPGVVTTTIDVPTVEELPAYGKIVEVAQQVIKAFD